MTQSITRRQLIATSGSLGALVLITACAPATTAPDASRAAGGFLSPGVGAPKRGGIIIGGSVGNEPAHFDPFQGGAGNSAAMPYERLLFERMDFFDDTARVGGLAERWEISPDGLRWTFFVRKGVKFQNIPPVNGRLMTAEDVAWNVRQYMTNSTAQATWSSIVDKVTVKDQYTAELTLKHPFPPFIKLAGNMPVLAHEVFEKDGHFRDLPIGTGPWMLDRWDRGSFMKLKANPGYWQLGLDGKPIPYASEFHAYFFKDESAAAAALRANQLHLYPYPDPISMDPLNFSVLKRDRSDLLYADGVRASNQVLFFNHSIPPWNDVRARRAISLGMNRQEIIDVGFQGESSITGLVPTNIKEWSWSAEKANEKYPHDKAAAQKMVKDLGLVGTPVEVLGGYTSTSGPAVQVLVAQLVDLGFKATPRVLPTLAQFTQILRQSTFQLAFGGIGTSAEVDDYLFTPWHSKSTGNNSKYSNPKADPLIDAQRRENDPAKRKQLIDQLLDLLWEDMAGAPICMRQLDHKVVNPKIKNLKAIHQHLNQYPHHSANLWIDG